MSHLPWQLIGLCLAALVAGAINSLAGGGTLLTFPALLAVLTPLMKGHDAAEQAAVIANVTSTVALVPGSLASAWGYRREMSRVRRWLLLLAGPSVVGGAAGALLLTQLPSKYFAALVPWLLLTAALLFLKESLYPRHSGAGALAVAPSAGAVAGLVMAQLGVAIYGGYFGAGIGILMLSALAWMGVGNIHEMNALKTLLGSCINGVSVAVFVAKGMVDWHYALPMAVAATVGGYLGARGSLRVPPRYVRWLVVAIGFGLAVYFFTIRMK